MYVSFSFQVHAGQQLGVARVSVLEVLALI
jgi:hypothetical protein